MLLTLDEERLRLSPEFVDNLISAENVPEPAADDHSPEAEQARKLRKYVGNFQLHTCSDNHCLRDDGKCEKRFPATSAMRRSPARTSHSTGAGRRSAVEPSSSQSPTTE
jgi:hypothetical protein